MFIPLRIGDEGTDETDEGHARVGGALASWCFWRLGYPGYNLTQAVRREVLCPLHLTYEGPCYLVCWSTATRNQDPVMRGAGVFQGSPLDVISTTAFCGLEGSDRLVEQAYG